MDRTQIREFWRRRADQQQNAYLWSHLDDLNFRFASAFVPRTGTLLDLGAGNCSLSARLAPSLQLVLAVDFAQPQPAAALPHNLIRIHSDIAGLDMSARFDLVLLFGVMNYFNAVDAATVYRKCRDWLNPTGTLLVKHQCGIGETKKVHGWSEELRAEYQAEYRTAEMESFLIAYSGFSVDTVDPYPPGNQRWPDTHFKAFIAKPRKGR